MQATVLSSVSPSVSQLNIHEDINGKAKHTVSPLAFYINTLQFFGETNTEQPGYMAKCVPSTFRALRIILAPFINRKSRGATAA